MIPKINDPVFISPMARITDAAFRSLAKKYGAGMTVTELINAKGLLQDPARVKRECQRADNEDHFAVQLFGSDPEEMALAAKEVEPYCDYIDINLGCPAYKICRVGAGSELLKHPESIQKIVSKMVNVVSIPVTVKTRIGINDNHISIFEVLQAVQNAGASMLSVHGRTRDQGYSGEANWDIIEQVQEKADIPIVGNGDITSPEIALQRLKQTEYVSIGRAASGNPLLFKQIKDLREKGSYQEYSLHQKLKVFEEYIQLSKQFETKLLLQKIQAQHFTKGVEGGSVVREKISRAKTTEELEQALQSFLE